MAYKVIQWATGAVGSLSLQEIVRRPDLELVGTFVYSPDKDGRDAGEIIGIGPTGVSATRDKDAILALEADCVVHTPLAASLQELDDDVCALLASGKNVISTAGCFAPEFRGQDITELLESACNAGGATLMGSGVEPGFMFDRVAPTLTGMCTDVEYLRLVEVSDALPSLDGQGPSYDPGFHATAATAVNAVASICDAPPGIFHQPVFAPWRRQAGTPVSVA